MSIAPYALSILRRQSLLLGEDFLRRYPHDWLVWEAGPWRPVATRSEHDTLTTLQPSSAGPARPEGEDCLCYPLQPFRGRVTAGRSTVNQIVINDLTASREHLQFLHDGAVWRLSSVQPGTIVGGVELSEAPSELRSGAQLQAGAVTLTFLSSADFFERVRREATRKAS